MYFCKNALQYYVNYGNIFLHHSVRLFGSSLKRNSHSLINLEYSKKGILPVKHDFANLGQAAVWENPPQTKEEALELLKRSPLLYSCYRGLGTEWKEAFLDFCRGKRSLPLTYDPFFKYLFHPDIHADRLSRFISSILGMKVRVVSILPNEDSLMGGETYLIMDLLAQLEDGSLVNIEIQKQGYAFPAERISCYSADLLLRQYARLRGTGKHFTYRDIKKVYVIVLFEESPAVFHECPGKYLHYGKTIFDTGLELELLQEFCLIALDVFREIPYTEGKKSEQKAWLSLLTTENLEDAERWIREYPWLEEIYQEIAVLRRKPEEVLGMWSEALRMLDENSLKYYVDELREQVKKAEEEKQKAEKEKDVLLQERNSALAEKDAEIEALKKQLAKLKEKN